ncbi:MAG TPA: CorA family divalent cation transporter [Candidatus Limnocylindrales bacterium]|nr:CorA family divalent cation transporter [Candidatus Limnocylindrales bacterium]
MTVRARLYDARGDDREVDLAELDLSKVDDRQLIWVDADDRSREAIGELARLLNLEREIVRQLDPDRLRPRLVRAPERIAVTLIAIEPDPDDTGKLVRKTLDVIAGRNLVVTVHDGRVLAIEELAGQIRGERDIGILDAGALLTGLVDVVIGHYLDEVEAIEREIDRLDTLALKSSRDDDDFLASVVLIRRRIALLRRSLTPNRNALGPLVRPDFQVHGDIVEPWPGIVERLERAIDAVENVRESLVGSFDLYLGRSAQRTNDVMKVLTLVSAILLPAAVLAGIMGMNFQLAFFDNSANFLLVLAAMVVLAVAILVIARWRRWI